MHQFTGIFLCLDIIPSLIMENLQQIADLIGQCTDCDLHASRLNAVPGEGDSNAEIMFIG